MKLTLLIATLLLTGCTTVVPVTQRWPEAPGLQATKSCANLKNLDTQPQLSQVAKTVSDNYSEYWQCAVKVDAWIEWYKQQEIIHRGFK